MFSTIAVLGIGLFVLYRLSTGSSATDDQAEAKGISADKDERSLMANVARAAEATSQEAEQMHRDAERHRKKTEFKDSHCGWFCEAEGEVRAMLRIARNLAEIDSQLAVDPKLREIYESIELAPTGSKAPVALERSPLKSDLSARNPPSAPLATGDPELDALQAEAFEERQAAFRGFLNDVRVELSRDRHLLRRFNQAAENRNIKILLNRLDLPGVRIDR